MEFYMISKNSAIKWESTTSTVENSRTLLSMFGKSAFKNETMATQKWTLGNKPTIASEGSVWFRGTGVCSAEWCVFAADAFSLMSKIGSWINLEHTYYSHLLRLVGNKMDLSGNWLFNLSSMVNMTFDVIWDFVIFLLKLGGRGRTIQLVLNFDITRADYPEFGGCFQNLEHSSYSGQFEQDDWPHMWFKTTAI